MKEITAHWAGCFAGVTAGEGCFVIAKYGRDNPCANHYCRFQIAFRDDDQAYLKEIQHTLQIGKIHDRPARHRPGCNTQPQVSFHVSAIEECVQLVRFFEKYPIPCKKRRDFEIWKEAVFELRKPADCRNADLLEYYRLKLKEIREYDEQEALVKPITIDLQLTINFDEKEGDE